MGKTITESDIIRALRMVGLKNTTKKVKEFFVRNETETWFSSGFPNKT